MYTCIIFDVGTILVFRTQCLVIYNSLIIYNSNTYDYGY